MDKSSTTPHCVTLRPCGNIEAVGLNPEPSPIGAMPTSVRENSPGKAAVAAPMFGLWKIAEYHRTDPTMLLTTLGLNTCVQFNWPSSCGWMLWMSNTELMGSVYVG